MNRKQEPKSASVIEQVVALVVVVGGVVGVVALVVLNVSAGGKPTLWQKLMQDRRSSRVVPAAELAAHPAMQLLNDRGIPLSVVIDYGQHGEHYVLGAPLHAVTGGEAFVLEVARVPYARPNKLTDHAGDASHTPSPTAEGLVETVRYFMVGAHRSGDHVAAARVRMAELPASLVHHEVDLGTVTIEGNVHVPAPGVNTYYKRDFKKSRYRVRVYVVSADEMEALDGLYGLCKSRSCEWPSMEGDSAGAA
jgi:hypothetical protein